MRNWELWSLLHTDIFIQIFKHATNFLDVKYNQYKFASLSLNIQKYVEGKIKNTACGFPFLKIHHHLTTTRCRCQLWNQGNLSHLLEISSTDDDWLTELKFLKQQEKMMQIRQGSIGISVLWFAMTEIKIYQKNISANATVTFNLHSAETDQKNTEFMGFLSTA